MATLPTTALLVRNYGEPTKLRCRCCNEANLYVIHADGGSYVLCAWCDLQLEHRFKRR